MTEKILTRLDFKDNRLQFFFAVLAFIEKNNSSRIFIVNESNRIILEECEKHIKFEKKENINTTDNYEIINISIDHSKPRTTISNYYTAPLIFPEKITNLFYNEFEDKIEKIYFRGLLTRRRFIETLFLFLDIGEVKASFILLLNLIRGNRNFTINTNKVNIAFTQRGRNAKFKFLDNEYYKEMAKYKYVFCPKGDFIWTYRFFEAIQVGSIPISKHSTPEYTDFFYLKKPHEITKANTEKAKKNSRIFKEKYNL